MRFIKKMLRIALITVVVLPLVYWLVLYVMQDTMMFPRHMMGPAPLNAEPGRPITEIVTVEIEGGTVEAWYAQPANIEAPAPAVMFFHGNAELIDYNLDIARMYHQLGFAVLLVEYRGYGRSAGDPGQEAIARDTVRFYDWLAERPEVDRRRIIFHGRSLGGAIACDLSTRREAAGLVLQSAFVSTAAVARSMLAPGFLVRHPFRNDRVLADYNGPVLLLHGRHDTIIPVHHSRELAEIAKDAKLIEFDSDHNDFPGLGGDESYREAIENFTAKFAE